MSDIYLSKEKARMFFVALADKFERAMGEVQIELAERRAGDPLGDLPLGSELAVELMEKLKYLGLISYDQADLRDEPVEARP